MNIDLVLIVAGAAALLTFLVAHNILQNHLRIGPPALLAVVVAALALFGLASTGPDLFRVLLLPYEALAVTLLLWFCLVCLTGWLRRNPGRRRYRNLAHMEGPRSNWRLHHDGKPASDPSQENRPTGFSGPLPSTPNQPTHRAPD